MAGVYKGNAAVVAPLAAGANIIRRNLPSSVGGTSDLNTLDAHAAEQAGLFSQMRDYNERKAREWEGDNPSFATKLAEVPGELPGQLAKYTLFHGPTGMAAAGALEGGETGGVKGAVQGGLEGYLTGKGLGYMAPASRPARVIGGAALFGAPPLVQGKSAADVALGVMTGAGMGAMGGRGQSMRELRRDPTSTPGLGIGQEPNPRVTPQDVNQIMAQETIPGRTARDSAEVLAREFPPPFYPARDAAVPLRLVDNQGPPITPPGIDLTTGKSARESAEAMAPGIPPLAQDLHPRTGNPLNDIQPGDYLPGDVDQRGGKSAQDAASVMSATYQGEGGRLAGAQTMDWRGNDFEVPRRIMPAPEGEPRFNSAEESAKVFEEAPPVTEPLQAPPEVAEEPPAQRPASPIETVTTAPETVPETPPAPVATGPLAEPPYEPPKPPTPTPLEEPKRAPVMQAPQPEASVPMPPPEEPPPVLPPQPVPPAPPPPPSQLPARRVPYSKRGSADLSFVSAGLTDLAQKAKSAPKATADAIDRVTEYAKKTPPGKFIRGMVQAVAPTSVVNQSAKNEFFAAKGDRELQNTLYDRAMKGMHTTLDTLPKQDQVNFIDRMMKGEDQPTEDLQHIAKFVRETTDSLFQSASKYSNALNYLDNYGVHIAWKTPPKHPDFDVNGRPVSTPQGGTMEGSKGFLKHRFWNTLGAGMKNGGEPISTNALDLLGMQVDSVSRFVSANRFWDGLKGLDQVQWVKAGEAAPEGFVRWNDPLAKQGKGTGAIGTDAPKGESGKGYWVVDQGAAKLLQNYLSRDYLRDIGGTEPGSSERAFANIGRGIMAIKNFHTSFELGFSGFHALFEAAEAQGSVMALGVRKLLNVGRGWDPIAGLKDLGESLVPGLPASQTFKLGKAARKFIDLNARDIQLDQVKSVEQLAANPLYAKMFKQYPDALDLMKDYFKGGGTFTLHKDFQMGMMGKLEKAMKDMEKDPSVRNYMRNLGLTASGLPEMLSYPLFHVYIPNLKMGLFMREYAQNLREQAPRIEQGLTSRQEVATRTLAFVEDRLGEMNFDNLAWNRTFKTMMQMGFRSVTWKLGSLRALAKAPLTQAREFKQAAQEGRAPLITPEAAWLAGMLGTTALIGGATHWAMSGKPPKNMTDVMFPQYDPNDETARFTYPSYAKELLHIQHDPLGYLKSGAAGMWSKYYEAAQNKDYYGAEIRDPDADVFTQTGQTLQHIFPTPISVSSRNRAAREGGSTAEQIGAFAGLPRAPKYAFEDKGTQALRELMMKQAGQTEGQSKSEFQRRQYMKGLERAYISGRNDQALKLADEGLSKGVITEADAERALEMGDKQSTPDDRFTYQARKLSLDNSLELWPSLNAHQRELLHDHMMEKFEKAAETKPEAKMLELIRRAHRVGFDLDAGQAAERD